jgi:phospholipid/cholesterol/gamma-HCH transport system substrate-binding protein
VTEGTHAFVRSTSLLGEKYVDLVAPSGASSLPELKNGAVIPAVDTGKAPELEQVFSQLGAILASGGLTDLGRLTSASAMILQGQEDDLGRVLDGTAKLVASIRAQREALASALDNLNQSARTLAANKSTLDTALNVQSSALGIVASQQQQLDSLITQLDRLGKPLADLTRAHKQDVDSQIRSLRAIVPQVYAVRATLNDAVKLLPTFAKTFARAAPGDYVQLDILVQSAVGTAAATSSPGTIGPFENVLLEATR